MVIKDKVLNMLAKADGNYVSGEDLARSPGREPQTRYGKQ